MTGGWMRPLLWYLFRICISFLFLCWLDVMYKSSVYRLFFGCIRTNGAKYVHKSDSLSLMWNVLVFKLVCVCVCVLAWNCLLKCSHLSGTVRVFFWIIYDVKWMKMSIVLQSWAGKGKKQIFSFPKLVKRNVQLPLDRISFSFANEFIHWIEWLPIRILYRKLSIHNIENNWCQYVLCMFSIKTNLHFSWKFFASKSIHLVHSIRRKNLCVQHGHVGSQLKMSEGWAQQLLEFQV